jgi:glyoxylase-like metal-dependent hydrolase (beta-lactamase superfamily II)
VERLKSAGIELEDIDRVILTHGHWDHIGGNVDKDGKPAFPKARFSMWKSEWEWWTAEDNLAKCDATNASYARENLPPIRERLDPIETESEIVPGICAIRAPGHTLGQIGLLITSEGEGLLHLADVAHHPIEFEHPNWSPWFEASAEESAATRRKLLSRAVDEKLLVMPSHFAFPGVGRVTRQGDGFGWQPI